MPTAINAPSTLPDFKVVPHLVEHENLNLLRLDTVIDEASKTTQKPSQKPAKPPASTPPTTPSNTPAPPVNGGPGETKTTQDQEGLAALEKFSSSEDLLQSIVNGNVPSDIRASPTAMLVLQQRLNNFQSMISLVSSMMKSMHDLQMELIRNLRI
jgi:hypothetical protein